MQGDTVANFSLITRLLLWRNQGGCIIQGHDGKINAGFGLFFFFLPFFSPLEQSNQASLICVIDWFGIIRSINQSIQSKLHIIFKLIQRRRKKKSTFVLKKKKKATTLVDFVIVSLNDGALRKRAAESLLKFWQTAAWQRFLWTRHSWTQCFPDVAPINYKEVVGKKNNKELPLE